MNENNRLVRQYWNDKDTVSLKDSLLKEIEMEQIKEYLTSKEKLFTWGLELGCGDGEGSCRYAEHVHEFIAVDYSLTMLQKAQLRIKEKGVNNCFLVCADVRHLPFSMKPLFDVIISERCLINLANWPEQADVLRSIPHYIKENGYWIFIEGTRQGLENLNRQRDILGLKPIPMPWHNCFFDEKELLPLLGLFFNIAERGSFWFYYLISRAMQPALVFPQDPSYDNPLNQIAAKLYHSMAGEFFSQQKDLPSLGQIFYLLLEKKAV